MLLSTSEGDEHDWNSVILGPAPVVAPKMASAAIALTAARNVIDFILLLASYPPIFVVCTLTLLTRIW